MSDPVFFRSRGARVNGHIAEKGSAWCVIVAEDGRSFKVRWAHVRARPGGERKRVLTPSQKAKARFRVHDRVKFESRGEVLRGTITRMNPSRALVACDNDEQWRVYYESLKRVSAPPEIAPEEVLEAVTAKAERLMAEHGLIGWSFQFDDASRRAGQCQYGANVLSMARQYALKAPEEDWTDTLLHEIAHALVGPGHGHDETWKRKAREIGCTAQRCHSVNFTPPRYIVSCPKCGTAGRRNVRTRNLVCRYCKGAVRYVLYSDRRWEEAQRRSAAS